MSVIEEVIGALDDPTRRALLDELASRGEATATQLAASLPITRQAISQHLSFLSEVGLVRGERKGRERWFTVRPERLTETARWLEDLARRWDRRLQTIKEIAES